MVLNLPKVVTLSYSSPHYSKNQSKLFLSVFRNFNFVTVMNYNVNMYVFYGLRQIL